MHKTLLPDVNVPVGVSDVGEMVFIAVGATRIMGRPINCLRTSFKVVIFLLRSRTLRPIQIRTQAGVGWVSSRHKLNFVRDIVLTFGRNVRYVSTLDITTFKLHSKQQTKNLEIDKRLILSDLDQLLKIQHWELKVWCLASNLCKK